MSTFLPVQVQDLKVSHCGASVHSTICPWGQLRQEFETDVHSQKGHAGGLRKQRRKRERNSFKRKEIGAHLVSPLLISFLYKGGGDAFHTNRPEVFSSIEKKE